MVLTGKFYVPVIPQDCMLLPGATFTALHCSLALRTNTGSLHFMTFYASVLGLSFLALAFLTGLPLEDDDQSQ